jgi:hypothetical protein
MNGQIRKMISTLENLCEQATDERTRALAELAFLSVNRLAGRLSELSSPQAAPSEQEAVPPSPPVSREVADLRVVVPFPAPKDASGAESLHVPIP